MLTMPIVAMAILIFAASDGYAQMGKGFQTSATLTGSDIAMIRKLVRENLAGKPLGTTLSWSNPESQNSGKVTLLDKFPSQGRGCVRVRYFIDPGPKEPASAQPSTYVITTCKLPDGTWKQDNDAKPDKAK
jgi:surface antigen